MYNLIWEFRYIIITVLTIALYCFLEWQKAKATGYALMLQAKSLAKDAVLKSGAQQEEWVVRKLYQYLPKAFTKFISEKTMRNVVHYLYIKAKDFLDDGQINNSLEQ
ncbi:MAG: hypothetical protein AB2417_02480 [Clostridiaceae bacterium]